MYVDEVNVKQDMTFTTNGKIDVADENHVTSKLLQLRVQRNYMVGFGMLQGSWLYNILDG